MIKFQDSHLEPRTLRSRLSNKGMTEASSTFTSGRTGFTDREPSDMGSSRKLSLIMEHVLRMGRKLSFIYSFKSLSLLLDFPGGSLVQNSPANAGDVGSIPE